MAMVYSMPPQKHGHERPAERDFKALLADLFRRAGWSIHEQQPADGQADMVVAPGGKKYAIEVQRSAEDRRDRLIPLLSQAILQAQAAARHFSNAAIPVAIVASPHTSDSVAAQVHQFALRHAPNVGIGVVDSEGFRVFHGFALEIFNSERSTRSKFGLPIQSESSTYLFSDLNQWMLERVLSVSLLNSSMPSW